MSASAVLLVWFASDAMTASAVLPVWFASDCFAADVASVGFFIPQLLKNIAAVSFVGVAQDRAGILGDRDRGDCCELMGSDCFARGECLAFGVAFGVGDLVVFGLGLATVLAADRGGAGSQDLEF
ncbi:hypothetical protein AK812_SmicGene5049 [Symbiodinium microadriaticum]|uniref:Uncharacterized protein n=1 Tax=Symbiodinium microadriaticum TaxID=2951 RepID=A0A1Q9EUQ7_SYMMI|nr:hypothetical protein AK812_SmicGene5049 [Symbiodinium microadriaticum]